MQEEIKKIGLRRGTVALEENTGAFADAIFASAGHVIDQLRKILGSDAVDIQHVGSTSIHGIRTKPIVDLAVGVRRLEDLEKHKEALEKAGIHYRGPDVPGQCLYIVGEGDIRTHHIHGVIYGSEAWNNYINFRDYLRQRPEIALRYTRLKEKLSLAYPNDRGAYTQGKEELIAETLSQAEDWRAMGADLPLTEYDPDPKGVIDPVAFYKVFPRVPKIFISCFALASFDRLLKFVETNGSLEKLGEVHMANCVSPTYRGLYQGVELGFVCAEVGASTCVGMFEELFGLGAETLILYGNCGVLDSSIDDLAIILPTNAVRDEGTSFHYAPPSREIPVNEDLGPLFEQMLKELKIRYHKGKTWTTDAFYRETTWKVQKRKEEGCICVDMEASSIASLAKLRGKKVLQFFYAGDNLDTLVWDERSLSAYARLDDKDKVGLIALEAARRIAAV